MQWIRNRETGLVWEVSDEHAKYLFGQRNGEGQAVYEKADAPTAAQAPTDTADTGDAEQAGGEPADTGKAGKPAESGKGSGKS